MEFRFPGHRSPVLAKRCPSVIIKPLAEQLDELRCTQVLTDTNYIFLGCYLKTHCVLSVLCAAQHSIFSIYCY